MSTLMVIDDEEPIRTALRQIFEEAGYVVLDAPNGKMAMISVRNNPVDLVITDIMMPEQDGLELIAWLRQNSPNVKIIAISGGGRFSLTEVLKIAQLMGAQRTFTKPVSLRELLATVKDLLNKV